MATGRGDKERNITMDNKKVIELMEQIDFIAHDYIDGDRQEELQNLISELQDEISKSDWVSVEDGLPPYDEEVLVCDEKEPSDMWFGHRTSDRRVVVDEHEFAKGYGTITHWHKIDKLED